MKSRIRILGLAAALFASSAAQAQFLGIFNGVTSAFTQVTGKLGNKITGGEKAKDIQAERDKFFSTAEAQMAGLDPAARQQLQATMAKSWSMAENSLLLANAQAQRAKDAPLIDLKQVARDTVGGLGAQVGMNSVFGGAGLGDVLKTATMDGVINGMGGQSSAGVATASRSGNYAAINGSLEGAVTGGVQAGANAAVAQGVTSSVSTGVSGLLGKLTGRGNSTFEASDATNPLSFLGKHPSELVGKDLYRENGFLGWKRIDASADLGAEAYAPITGDGPAKAAVFNYDKTTGSVTAAFRVLNADPGQFTNVVEAIAKQLGAAPRYASTGSVMRAVWESGAFVAADSAKVSAGWSAIVPQAYAAAGSAVASN